MPPLTFTQINTIPDILTTDRYKVNFGNVQGVDTKHLTMVHTHVTRPEKGTGHVRVVIMGFPFGFPAGKLFDNQMTISFYEVVGGKTLAELEAWLELANSTNTNTNAGKKVYSCNVEIDQYDSTGAVAIRERCVGVFPLSIQRPELDDTSTVASQYTVMFNVDYITPFMATIEGDGLS